MYLIAAAIPLIRAYKVQMHLITFAKRSIARKKGAFGENNVQMYLISAAIPLIRANNVQMYLILFAKGLQ